MYLITFYSYKGGVGRTLALVNVATLLARKGKRVLVVDFDLEAPGLPSYRPFTSAKNHPGILDYVEEYRRDLVAPDASKFIVECPLGDDKIWIMPAGASNKPSYTARLNGFDWEKLYSDESGYLMFEDLKHQWANYPSGGFDYVLVDSRTGHTDVGGICTRQLPNAVVVMFMPNDQNIDGLTSIVKGIRNERESGKQIAIHFCASNVPDEYDEDDIVTELLAGARERLKYGSGSGPEGDPELIIHHRISLALLKDPLIVETRPKSKLAREYTELLRSVAAANLVDPEGAKATLYKILGRVEPGNRQSGPQLKYMEGQLADIVRLHPANGEISMLAAEAFRQIGSYEQVVQSTTRAIDLNWDVARAHLLRGLARMAMDDADDAVADFKRVLINPQGTTSEYRPAADLLRLVSEEPREAALEVFQNKRTGSRAKLELAPILTGPRGDFDLVADALLKGLRDEVSDLQRDNIGFAAALALIAAGRFKEVLEKALPDANSLDLPTIFNRAIAQWGLDGVPPAKAFERFAERIGAFTNPDANSFQCFALAYWVLGRKEEALEALEEAKARAAPIGHIFSCWTYTHDAPAQFLSDLQAMRRLIKAGKSAELPVLEQALATSLQGNKIDAKTF